MGFKARLTRSQRIKKLLQAIDTFKHTHALKRAWDESEWAEGECYIASSAFQDELSRAGISSTIKCYEEQNVFDYPYYQEFFETDTVVHYVVRVGNLLIDWTSRQFKPDAPFPTIWEA